MTYCMPVFSRGTGLGNRLWPWARCCFFSELHGIPMLAPFWLNLRIGPLLRGGIDYTAYRRQILLLDLFRADEHSVRGLRRAWSALTLDRTPEPDDLTAPYVPSESCSSLVIFEGGKQQFQSLRGFDEFIHRELRAITRSRWLEVVDGIDDVPVAVNVRRARDFPDPDERLRSGQPGPVRTPLRWFVDSLRIVREQVGRPATAYVVSDGSPNDLRPLLELENVRLLRPGCAISDLLVLARARVLIGSGGSSFSAWAAFLGQMPTITYPGHPLTWFKLTNRHGLYLGEFDPRSPSEPFLRDAAKCLSGERALAG